MPPNFATVEKVKEGFEKAGDRMNTIEREMTLAYKELSETMTNLRQTLASYGRSVLNASERAGDYQGFWRNEAMAKEFGLIILSVLRKRQKHGDCRQSERRLFDFKRNGGLGDSNARPIRQIPP